MKKEEVMEPVAEEPQVKKMGIRVLADSKGNEHEYMVTQVGDSFECTPHSFVGDVEIRESI